MENRVDEFCLWVIQAIIIPITVGTLEGWSTGYFDELNSYEEECAKIYDHSANIETDETLSSIESENKGFKAKIWSIFTFKNTMYFIFATQAIHLIYAVYVGKQFPVQPLSDFENSNIIWETICLCARDATIAMNSHILILRLSCRVIYDVGTSIIDNLKPQQTQNKTDDDDKAERSESGDPAVISGSGDSCVGKSDESSPEKGDNDNSLNGDTHTLKIFEEGTINKWVEILDVD